MALPQIAPLSSEFDMPSGNDAIQKEITKLGQVIIEKSTQGLKSATQAVITSVPKMITDLTKEIESGPIDNFALAMRKLIKLVDELGIDLRDYNRELADTVQEFTGSQQKLEEKISELREQGIRAEIDEKGNAIKILTQREIKEKEVQIQTNNKQLKDSTLKIKEFTKQLELLDPKQKEEREVLTQRIEAESDHLKYLEKQNEDLKKSSSITTDTGGGMQGFGKLAELREAFMVIPDTITEVFTTFKDVGTKVFGGFISLFKEPGKALKSIGASLGAIGNLFKTARILIALKVLAVVAAIQFFAEKIESIGSFFVGVWEKITGFFQGIVDWFKNSAIGKFFGLGGKEDKKESSAVADKNAGTAGDMAGETYLPDDNLFNAPVRNMTSATLEDGLVNQTIDPTLSDYDDDTANIIKRRNLAGLDGEGTEEIDYTGMRGGTSLSKLGIKNRQVVGDQLQTDDTMYGGVSESLKELNAEASASPNVINIQNNSNVNSQSSSGTTVSGFVDHEPDTSFKYIRSGATGSDQF